MKGDIMNNESVVTILNEEFENDKTGEKVQGLTIIVDGKLKQVMDIIMEKDENYNNYTEIVRDSLFNGINNLINKINKSLKHNINNVVSCNK